MQLRLGVKLLPQGVRLHDDHHNHHRPRALCVAASAPIHAAPTAAVHGIEHGVHWRHLRSQQRRRLRGYVRLRTDHALRRMRDRAAGIVWAEYAGGHLERQRQLPTTLVLCQARQRRLRLEQQALGRRPALRPRREKLHLQTCTALPAATPAAILATPLRGLVRQPRRRVADQVLVELAELQRMRRVRVPAAGAATVALCAWRIAVHAPGGEQLHEGGGHALW